MSPEQAEGRLHEFGPATDIYSLGATLYVMLTGRTAFPDQNAFVVLEQVRQGQFPRPRQVLPQAPAPLESICLKAMALRPEDRYKTALALAEDVEHWLADEPVLAHCDRLAERVGRWMRRHRSWTLAGGAATVLIAVVSLAATFLVNRARENATNLAIANAALAESEHTARVTALDRLREARGAVDTWLTGTSEILRHYPGVQQARKLLLQEAEKDYARFAGQASDDPDLEIERGRACLRLGDVRKALSETDPALESYRSAAALFQTLLEKQLMIREAAVELANSQTRIGMLMADLGRHAESDAAYGRAIAKLQEISQGPADQADPAQALALAQVNRASLLAAMGRREETEKSLHDAVANFQRSLATDPAAFKSRAGVAAARDLLGRLLAESGRCEDAAAELRLALAGLDGLLQENPGNPEYLESRASTRICLAGILRMLGRDEDELAAYRAAISDYELLARNLPDIPTYRENLAITWTDMGQLLHDSSRCAEAETELRRALPVLDELNRKSPQIPRYLEERAACRDVLAQALLALGRKEESQKTCAAAAEDFQNLSKQFPEIVQYRERLALNRGHLAEIEEGLQQYDQAAKLCLEATRAMEEFCKLAPAIPVYRNELAYLDECLGRIRLAQKDTAAAKEAFQHAILLRRKLADEHPVPEYVKTLAWLISECPLVELRDPAEAVRRAREARQQAPRNANYATVLGAALYRHGDYALSVAACEEACQLRQKGTAMDWLFMAMAQAKLAKMEKTEQNYRQAVKWIQANCPQHDGLSRLQNEAKGVLSDRSSKK